MKHSLFFLFFIFLIVSHSEASEEVDYTELDKLIHTESPQYDYEKLDPYYKYNKGMLRFNMFIFRNTMLPFIYLIDAWVPRPILSGFRNFTQNLSEPKNYIIYKFSGEHEKAKIVARRFFTNTLFGTLGLINVAQRKWGDEYEHKHESFDYMLKKRKDTPGKYVVYPLLNNYYHREFAASNIDWLLNPIFYFNFPFNYIYYIIDKAVILSKHKETLYQNRLYSDEVYENLRNINTHEVYENNN